MKSKQCSNYIEFNALFSFTMFSLLVHILILIWNWKKWNKPLDLLKKLEDF